MIYLKVIDTFVNTIEKRFDQNNYQICRDGQQLLMKSKKWMVFFTS